VAKVTDERLPRLPRDHVGVRKSIARVLTVHNTQQSEGLRKAAAGSKYMPARFAYEVRPASVAP
jgi:large subunit ribosomal protein L35e